MVNMNTIQNLQTTFHDIGRAEVGVKKEVGQGVAFGRNVTSPAQGPKDAGSIAANNKAIMGSVLGQLKGAGANTHLMKFAELMSGKMDQSKPLTGRAVENFVASVAKAAVVFGKSEMSSMKMIDANAKQCFNRNFPAILNKLSQAQGHGNVPMDKQSSQIMQNAFTKLCKQCVNDTGLPPNKGQIQTFMKNIAQSFTNRDTHKTICNAALVLRTRLEGGLSPSEMAFHEKAAARGMTNVPLDNAARSMINAMWANEYQTTLMGANPHHPREGEIEGMLDKVLDKFLDRVALEGPPKAQIESPFTSPSHIGAPRTQPQAPTTQPSASKPHAKEEKTVGTESSTVSHHHETPSAAKKKKADADEPKVTELKTDAKPEEEDTTKAQKSKTKLEITVKHEAEPESSEAPKAETKPTPSEAPKAEAKPTPSEAPKAEVKPTPSEAPKTEPKSTPTAEPQVGVKTTPKPVNPEVQKLIDGLKDLEDIRDLMIEEELAQLEQEVEAEDYSNLSTDLFETIQDLQDMEAEARQSLQTSQQDLNDAMRDANRLFDAMNRRF